MRTLPPRLLSALFLIALAAPFTARWLRPGAAEDSVGREMRQPAAFPPAPRSLAQIGAWPARLALWHEDSLGLRDQLVRANSALELLLFRRCPNEGLFLGRDDWIFLTGGRSLEAWRGQRVLEPALLEGWVRELRARAAWCRAQGSVFLHVCTPNKQTTYAEKLPASESPCGPTPLEQLLARFAREPEGLPFLDLRAALREEKRYDRPEMDDFVFHAHGSHWTPRGAFAAVRAIVARLQPEFPRLEPPRREDYELRELPGDSCDNLAYELSLEDVLHERVWDFAPRRPAARCVASDGGPRFIDVSSATWENALHPELPSTMLVSDSFGPWLHPLLAEHASRLVFAWTTSLPLRELKAAHPALVIELYVERHLADPPLALSPDLQLLRAEEFLGFPPLQPATDDAQRLRGIDPWLGTACERCAEGLRVRASGPLDKLLLPPLDPGAGRRLALRLSLRAPHASVGLLWCTTRAQPEYQQHERMAFDVAAGENEIYFKIPVDGVCGRILLVPGLADGEYVLHSLEARSAPR